MKWIVFSDSHGNTKNMESAIQKFENEIDAIVHLGDYVEDVEKIKNIYTNKKILQVAGNNDFSSIPEEKILNLNEHKIFLTHGHYYNVYFGVDRLNYKARELGVNVVLYGHSHKPFVSYEDELLILNPGSISAPRGFSVCSFAILEILEEIKYKFYGFFDEDIKEIQ